MAPPPPPPFIRTPAIEAVSMVDTDDTFTDPIGWNWPKAAAVLLLLLSDSGVAPMKVVAPPPPNEARCFAGRAPMLAERHRRGVMVVRAGRGGAWRGGGEQRVGVNTGNGEGLRRRRGIVSGPLVRREEAFAVMLRHGRPQHS